MLPVRLASCFDRTKDGIRTELERSKRTPCVGRFEKPPRRRGPLTLALTGAMPVIPFTLILL